MFKNKEYRFFSNLYIPALILILAKKKNKYTNFYFFA